MPDWELIHGDCFDVLPTLAAGSIDAVITDPPYAEQTHAGARGARPGVGLTTAKLIHFGSLSEAAFLAFARECVRVTRRWVVMTCDWRHAAAAEREGLPVGTVAGITVSGRLTWSGAVNILPRSQ